MLRGKELSQGMGGLHNDFVPGRSGWRRPAGTWPSALQAPGILWGGDTDLGLNSMLQAGGEIMGIDKVS